MAVLIENLTSVLEEFQQSGFSVFQKEWQKCDLLRGEKVVITNSDVGGIAQGVDASGALRIDTGGELLLVNAGEVSVRPHEA